jgi:hypothetical protein
MVKINKLLLSLFAVLFLVAGADGAERRNRYAGKIAGDLPPALLDALNRLASVESGPAAAPGAPAQAADPWVNVKAHGAKGDGHTDDSAAIQAAINAGGITFVPKGDYVIGAAIILPSGATLKGDAGSVFIRPDNTEYKNSTMIQNKNFASDIRVDVNIVVRGISIVGNRAKNSTPAIGIYMRSATNVRIEDCFVTGMGRTPNNFSGSGIVISNVLDGVIEGNYAYANAGDGIDAFIKNSNILIQNNTASYNGVAGIELEGRLDTNFTDFRNRGIVVTGNRVFNNSGGSMWAGIHGHGILLLANDAVTVSDNMVSGNSVWVGAITGMGNTGLNITNNVVTNNIIGSTADPGASGIALWAQYDVYGEGAVNKDVFITGNVLMDNKNGIFARDTQSLTIQDNVIIRTDDTNNGIHVDAGTVGKTVTISNNTIKLSGSGPAIAVKGPYSNVTITGNTAESTGIGVLLYPASVTFDKLNITDNTFDTSTYGIYAYYDQAWSNGRIEKNTFSGTYYYDLAYDTTSPLLSSFFISDNVHDKGFYAGPWGSTSSAPTTGSWKAGDRIVNKTPAVGQPKAWVCTASGTPGVWVSEGDL